MIARPTMPTPQPRDVRDPKTGQRICAYETDPNGAPGVICGRPHNAKGRCATHYGHIRRDRPRPPEGQRPRRGADLVQVGLRVSRELWERFERERATSELGQSRAIEDALELWLVWAVQDRLDTHQGLARPARTVRTPRGSP